MKNFFRYFLYASVVFLLYSLAKADYLKIPVVFSNKLLLLSFITLFAGFLISCFSWKKTLNDAGYVVSFRHAISSIGLAAFGKYIPGKIWMILGEAGYVQKKYNYPLNKLITLSFNAQLLSIWTGLLTGSVGLCIMQKYNAWWLAIIVLWFLLTLVLFTDYLHRIAEWGLKKILSEEYQLPRFTFSEIIKLLPSYFGYWMCWALSFYFLAAAISPENISFSTGWGFPLSATLGIIVIIAPGGIGVREGFLVSYLVMSGFDLKYAAIIAVASRLWYLSGEFFIFLAGFILDRKKSTQ